MPKLKCEDLTPFAATQFRLWRELLIRLSELYTGHTFVAGRVNPCSIDVSSH